MDVQQAEGVAPLLGMAVLVVQNCEGCRGTGLLVETNAGAEAPWKGRDPLVADVPVRTVPHGECEGSGRVVVEMPVEEFAQLAQLAQTRYVAPAPSAVRSGS